MPRVIKSRFSADYEAVKPFVLDLPRIHETDDAAGQSRISPEEILDQARQQAQIIVMTARSEAEDVRRAAYDDGYRAGIEEAGKTAEGLIARLEHDITAAAEDKKDQLEALEPQILKLCREIVEKIIRHEIRTNSHVVVRTVKSCLRRIKNSDEVRVRVSPQEVEAVRAQREELKSLAEGISGIHIVDDRRISPGGCVVESASGDIDARVETQLELVNTRIQETYEREHYSANSGPEQV